MQLFNNKACRIETKSMQKTMLAMSWLDKLLFKMLRNFQHDGLLWILCLQIPGFCSRRHLGTDDSDGHQSSSGGLRGQFVLTYKDRAAVLRFSAHVYHN